MKFMCENSVSAEYDSEGNRLTPEQIELFKNSKIRNKQGRLQVCYHGSQIRNIEKFNSCTMFSDSIELANEFTFNNGQIYRCYINTASIITFNANNTPFNDLKIKGESSHINDLIEKYKGQYDCIVIHNILEYSKYIVTDYIVCNPNVLEPVKYDTNIKKSNNDQAIYETLPEFVYHATHRDNLKSIIQTGLKDFWFGIDLDECVEFVTYESNHDWLYEDIIVIEIPTSLLSVENCDFGVDRGNGIDDIWAGTGFYGSTINVKGLDSYHVDDEKWYYIR